MSAEARAPVGTWSHAVDAAGRVAAAARRHPGRSAAAAAGALATLVLLARAASRTDEVGEAAVRRGPLVVTVSLSGVLAPARAESYGAEVPGVEMKILELAPEGARVGAGARLIRFDAAPFERELAAAEAKLREARSEAEQARQGLAALLATEESDRRETDAQLRRAELELRTFVNGTSPLAVQQSAAAVERAEREAADAAAKRDGLAPFAEKGYVARDELRAAERRAEQAEADLALARRQHETLVAYTNPQLVAEKEAEVELRRAGRDAARRKGTAQAAQARAAAELARARVADAERLVTELARRIALCVVVARSAGLVVYRDVWEKTGERRRVRVGDSVFAGQSVLDLPDLSDLLVEGRVKESDVHRLAPGQGAEVTLDAFPGRVFSGRVVRLGALSGAEKGEGKSFPLVLSLAASDPLLRPGMSARAVVKCDEVRDALVVPIDAVRFDAGATTCLVKTVTGPKPRPIRLGKTNAFYAEVVDGLSEGDVVLLTTR